MDEQYYLESLKVPVCCELTEDLEPLKAQLDRQFGNVARTITRRLDDDCPDKLRALQQLRLAYFYAMAALCKEAKEVIEAEEEAGEDVIVADVA